MININGLAAMAIVTNLAGYSRPKWADERIAELAAEGCLAFWDYRAKSVRWFPKNHDASIAHFASPKQHPGALNRRQLRLIKKAMRGER